MLPPHDVEQSLLYKQEQEDKLFLAIAGLISAHRGSCIRRNVGAVLVAAGRLREIGWNGMERGALADSCVSGACPRGRLSEEEQPHGSGYINCVYLHAEFNVLENFRHSQGLRHVPGWAGPIGVVVYASSEPCEDCQAYAKWAGAELRWSRDA